MTFSFLSWFIPYLLAFIFVVLPVICCFFLLASIALLFLSLVAASRKCQPSGPQLKFIKKLGSIPTVSLRVEDTCRSALNLTERGLIGQFTGSWPSPKGVEDWVKPN